MSFNLLIKTILLNWLAVNGILLDIILCKNAASAYKGPSINDTIIRLVNLREFISLR